MLLHRLTNVEYYLQDLQSSSGHIGDIHLYRDDYIGAMKRYTGIFNSFPDGLHPLIEEFALCRLSVLSKMLLSDEEAEKYKQMLMAKYPNNGCFG